MVLLVIVAIFIASFSSASYNTIGFANLSTSAWNTVNNVWSDLANFRWKDTFCIVNDNNYACKYTVTYWDLSASVTQAREIACLTWVTITSDSWPSMKNNWTSTCTTHYIAMDTKDLRPEYTSLQCQTEYNLIPISSVDQNYCTSNNLCPSCPSCPAGSGWVSTLYINNILHVWAPNMYMTIPEEIWRDYEYTQWGTNMLIDVEGYNVDYEKMQSVIDQQNYKPTQEDFQNLILILWPYSQIILFFVFLFLIWAWIKKPFKSKKI